GAILMDGTTALISGLTLANNTAGGRGGGIAVEDNNGTRLAAAQVNVSTISGNTAASLGGGLYEDGTASILRLTDTTVTRNTAANGGGIDSAAGTLGFGNTIVAGNTAGASPDVVGTVASQGFNLVGDGTGATGFVTSDQVGTAAAPIDSRLSLLT